MPSLPRRSCPIPSCTNLAPCSLHGSGTTTGKTAAQRGYDSAWRTRRAAFLAAHPRCVLCGQPSEVADHNPPRAELVAAGVPDPDDERWLTALCTRCHNAKTRGEQG